MDPSFVLPLVLGALIAGRRLPLCLHDGFDLGLGILFPPSRPRSTAT
jgi:cytochrome bd-type quinol oxidase subunit 2